MNIKNQNIRTFLSLGTSIFAMLISLLINFFLAPYIVENFGEEANGFTQLANNFVNYATLITIALNSMASRYMTISYHKNDIRRCNKYYSSVMMGNLFIIILLIVPAMICVAKLDEIVNIETVEVNHVKRLFAFVFANFFVSQINSVYSISMYVKNAQFMQNIINMMRNVLNVLGLLLFYCIFEPRIYYVSLVGLILSILTLPCFCYIKKRILPEIKFDIESFSLGSVKELIASGIWNTITQCGNLLMSGLDLLLSNLFIGPIQMGILSVAKTIPNCIIQLAQIVNSSFSPNLTIAYAEDEKNTVLRSIRYSMTCSCVLVSIPIMVLCIYGASFYSLWVPSMNANQLTVLSVLTCMAFIPFAGPQTLFNVFTTTNKLKLNSISILVGGVVNTVAVYLLLRYTEYGLIAIAGTSSVVSIIRNLVITIPFTARALKLKWYTFYKDVLVSCICCGMNAVCCYMWKYIIVPNGWLTLIVSVAIACVFCLLLSFVVLFNRNEKKKFIDQLCYFLKRRRRNG